MQLIQSYLFSISRCSLSLYEQRVILRLVEYAQVYVKDKDLRELINCPVQVRDNVLVKMPLRDVLGDCNNHYDYARDAFRSLMTKRMEFWSVEHKYWFATPIVYNIEIGVRSAAVRFYVARRFFDALLDFHKGYSQYNLDVAMSLSSAYSVRLYMIFCNQRQPLTWKIDILRSMLCGDSDVYPQSADFIKRVIEPARRELERRGVNGFSFTKVTGTRGRTVALTFHPVKREVSGDALRSQVNVTRLLGRQLYILLTSDGGFTYKELSAHKKLWEAFQKVPECLSIALDIINRASRDGKTKGWVIQAIRGECVNHGIVI